MKNLKTATKKRRLLNIVVVLAAVVSMLIPAGAVQAAAKPKVKITTSMGASNKMYMGASKALNAKTSTPSTVTYKTSNANIAAVKSGKIYAYKPGSVTVKISAKPKSSKYQTGTVTFKMDVLPKKPSTPSASRSGGKINVSVNTIKGVTGYQFLYATNSEFSGYKRITTKKTTGSFSASDSKTYYVKARSYATVSGKNLYSGWSTVKKINKAVSGPKFKSIKIWNVKVQELIYTDINKKPSYFYCSVEPFESKEYVIWKSSNSNVAKVDSEGCVTLVGPGTCTITVSSPDGKVSDSRKITIAEKITKVTLDKTDLLLANDCPIRAEVYPNLNYSDCPVKWKTSNSKVAVIDNRYGDGKFANIRVKGNGTCTITAYAANNPSVKATCKVTVALPNGLDPNHPYIKRCMNLVNQEREKAGLAPLAYDEKLSKAAMIRVEEISKMDDPDHVRLDGRGALTVLDDVGAKYTLGGENLASGYINAETVMNSWMLSEGHRYNILFPYFKKVGIGFYVDNEGQDYWIQLFTD